MGLDILPFVETYSHILTHKRPHFYTNALPKCETIGESRYKCLRSDEIYLKGTALKQNTGFGIA